jgi:hypothetical protein
MTQTISSALLAVLKRNNYTNIKVLPDGTICALIENIYTTGIVIGLDEWSWKRRYCYEYEKDALEALDNWEGIGDPSGPWIKEKPSERLGPGAVGK